MEQLYDIKKRIRSISDIQQMTHAMELVSAAKMRKSKAQLDRVFPFFSLCAESMIEIQRSNVDIDNPYFKLKQKQKGETWKIGYFILTGDQGLAGAYNHNVIRIAEDYISKKAFDNVAKGLKTESTLYVFGNVGRRQRDARREARHEDEEQDDGALQQRGRSERRQHALRRLLEGEDDFGRMGALDADRQIPCRCC